MEKMRNSFFIIEREKMKITHKNVATEKVITPLISVPSGRFPRTPLQSPRRENRAPAGLSECVVSAGVAALHSNQLEY